MDRLSTTTADKSLALVSLLRGVRTRIWLFRSLSIAHRWFGVTAAALMLLAIFHTAVRPVPVSAVLVLAAVMLLMFTRQAYGLRPTLRQSAVVADKTFRTSSLLTTALECIERGTDTAASRIVTAQAVAMTNEMGERLGELRKHSERPEFLWPVIATAVSALILSLPGNVQPERAGGEGPKGMAEASQSLVPESNVGDPATALRQALSRSAEAVVTGQIDDGSEEDSTAYSPLDPSNVTASNEPAQSAEALADPFSAGAGAGDEAGRGSGINDEPAQRAARQMASRTAIEIQRGGIPVAGASNIGTDLANAEVPSMQGPISVRAASPPQEGSTASRMSPAQASFAARYVAEIRNRAQGNEDE